MLKLILWRWVVTFHDRLHDARDKKTITKKYGTWNGEAVDEDGNVIYTSPAVHYLGRD